MGAASKCLSRGVRKHSQAPGDRSQTGGKQWEGREREVIMRDEKARADKASEIFRTLGDGGGVPQPSWESELKPPEPTISHNPAILRAPFNQSATLTLDQTRPNVFKNPQNTVHKN
jgi:hypothetical protein